MEDQYIPHKWEPIDFTIYFRFTWLIAVVAIVVEIALRILGNKLGSGILYDHREAVSWAIRIVFFAVIGWRAVKAFGGGIMIGVISGLIAGFMVGLVISLFRFADGVAVWKFFNVFTEIVSCMVVGALISMISVYIISKFRK